MKGFKNIVFNFVHIERFLNVKLPSGQSCLFQQDRQRIMHGL